MACTGPVYPKDEQIEKVSNRLMEVLKNEFNIFACGEPTWPSMLKARKDTERRFKESIKEILYQENCETF